MSHNVWTEAEYDYLRENAFKIPTRAIADHLGRSLQTVYARFCILGLKKPTVQPNEVFERLTVKSTELRERGITGHKGTWCNCQCECGNEYGVWAYSLRSGHTKSCGCRKGLSFGGKRWSDDEKEFLISNAHTMTTEEIAKHLGRAATSVSTYIYKMGLVRKGRVGQKLGRLTIQGILTVYRCECECGNVVDRYSKDMGNEENYSCGCGNLKEG